MLIVPIGAVPADVIEHVRLGLGPITGHDVTVAAPMALPPTSQRQYLGEALLQELERRYADANAGRVVGLIDADAYAPRLNFIFGQARLPGRYAVVALPRLRNSFYGRREDPARFRERALKVTAHELGHSLGFAHCPNETCVMHFANSVFDADRQGSRYCRRETVSQ